jgi:hypothetical protein
MRLMLLALCVAGLSACSEKKPEPDLSGALPTLLVPPNSSVVSREGGTEALKIRFHSQFEPEQVARYYREVLSKPPWNLVSDTPDREGTIALYAERPDGPPLWVSISKVGDGSGSYVDLAGATVSK